MADDAEEGDLFSLSPLSSLDASPTDSPISGTAELPSNSDARTASFANLAFSAAASKKRKSHAHRRRKRSAEKANLTPHDYEIRPSTRRKYISKDGLKTELKSEDAPIAKTGFVGIRSTRSSAIYSLKQLVGPKSRFGFEMVEWDGR